jgi:hypothetical protein
MILKSPGFILVAAMVAAPSPAAPQGAEVLAQTAPDSPGPTVGARVPDFQLSDQTGVKRSLQSIMGPKGMMLVFFRSADW